MPLRRDLPVRQWLHLLAVEVRVRRVSVQTRRTSPDFGQPYSPRPQTDAHV